MRLTIGKKLNSLIVALQILSIGGTVFLATGLFTDDLSGLLRKGTIDESTLLAGRVRAEMKHVADRVRMLGSASMEQFQYEADRIQFIQNNLSADNQSVSLGVYRKKSDQFVSLWRIVNSEYQEKLKLSKKDFDAIDQQYPLDLESVSNGQVDFTVASLKDGTPILRMAIPFVQKKDGSFSQFLVVELHQERLTSLFSESTAYTSFLVDRRSKVLGSSDPTAYPLGQAVENLDIVKASLGEQNASGQKDFEDANQTLQMGAFHKIGFAGLTVVTQVPFARALQAKNVLYRRTGLLAGIFLSLALALGFIYSQSITKPVQALAGAAELVKQGDFSVRLPIKKENPDGTPNGDEIQQFSGTFNEMVSGLEERDKIKTTFAKFHSQEMADKVLSGELKLGGERKNAFVFFSDVRGFTALSEGMDPEALVGILNRYMTYMVQVILEHGR